MSVPNPRRVAAGRRNRALRGPLTAAGRKKLGEAALRNRPWRFSTGPTTDAGRRQAAENGRTRQVGSLSVRAASAEIAKGRALIRHVREVCAAALAR